MSQQLLLLELNEINFEFLEFYISQGHLPVLKALIDRHGYARTTTEMSHAEVEPWIQWVTAHSGLSFAEHGVFRLGDIEGKEIDQIWERLEREGNVLVGAMSPMNAVNRTRSAAFFVPDPWVNTSVSGNYLIRKVYGAIRQAVVDNVESQVQLRSLFWLLIGAVNVVRLRDYSYYLSLLLKGYDRPWSRAIILDQLLTDIFVSLVRRTGTEFASVFLNGGAHIQHHYLFNSKAYLGDQQNPSWYVAKDRDPVLDVYRHYDRTVGRVVEALPDSRVMIATGLHQDPHPEVTYYWRLRDHEGFLRKIGVDYQSIKPRMSRDFLVVCNSSDQAKVAENTLNRVRVSDGTRIFDVDNRGDTLFVMLTYPHEIDKNTKIELDDEIYDNFYGDVAFVAIKNGQHNSTGYFLDTGVDRGNCPTQLELRELPERIMRALCHS